MNNLRKTIYHLIPLKRELFIIIRKIWKPNEVLSNKNGTTPIFDTDAEHTYSVIVGKNMHTAGANVVETTIQTITLSSLIHANMLEKIDFIKVDIETHEPEVLEGLGEYLAEFNRRC